MDETKFTKDAPNTSGVDSAVGGWRWVIKGKQRGCFSYKDQVDLKIQHLRSKIYSDFTPCEPWMIRQCYYREDRTYDFIDEDYRPIMVGEHWGGKDVSAFWKQTIKLSDKYKGKKVVLMLYLEGDSMVKVNGVPYQGLDPFRSVVHLTDCANGDEVYDIEIESYYQWHSNETEIKTLMCSHLAVVNEEVEELYWDYKAVYNGLFMPNMDSSLEAFLTKNLVEAVKYIDPYAKTWEEYIEKVRIGAKMLREKVLEGGEFHIPGKLHLVGHSHLDLVFLWPYREFVRKTGRTHAAMLRLMDQFDEFIFTQSQPCMYNEMKNNYPELFEQVKQRIKEGRWEAIGAFWVEPDCNLISGESFVRQALHGTRFYEKEFGVETHTCWLPDVFGNAYTMPQILKKSGVDYFVTHKMNIWNDTNPWKDHEFWWEGPDGSRVFACVPPTHFIGTMEPDHLAQNWQKFSGKDGSGESIFCYGWGDGGGGCDAEMIQYVKRYKHFPGLPDAEATKAEDALRSIAEKGGDKAIVWKDELYLEAHRGVTTTKAELKKRNRRLENLYREAELYGTIAKAMGFAYPADELYRGWQMLLTTQFHDSLPGSHITEVFHTLIKELTEVEEIGRKAKNDALDFLAKKIKADKSLGAPIAVFNSLPYVTTSLSAVESDAAALTIVDVDGNAVPCQKVTKVDGTSAWVFLAKDVPSVGFKVFYVKEAASDAKSEMTVSEKGMENRFFKIAFDEKGEIVSIYDKIAGRETLAEGGRGNVFRLYEDMPGKYEAWDITKFYYDREIPLDDGKIEVCDNGPVCASVLLKKKINESDLTQRIVIYNDVPRIDFDTMIDWHETRKLLKVGFDVDIQAKKFTRDIAYGAIESPNYRYTQADQAKFEVSAHNWIDLSDPDYGVSLLNDCKYGHEVTRNNMRITLLKASLYPDPEADRGINTFTYSYYPHQGTWVQAETVQRGLEINVPLTAVKLDGTGSEFAPATSFGGVNVKNVTLEALKKAEDDDGVIIRYVERCGESASVVATLPFEAKKVYDCSLIEKVGEELPMSGKELRFDINPFEIKCFKVVF